MNCRRGHVRLQLRYSIQIRRLDFLLFRDFRFWELGVGARSNSLWTQLVLLLSLLLQALLLLVLACRLMTVLHLVAVVREGTVLLRVAVVREGTVLLRVDVVREGTVLLLGTVLLWGAAHRRQFRPSQNQSL